jgi:hypothetical protein
VIDDRKLPKQVRRAFYEGLTRVCLDWAWLRLDDHRQQKKFTRLFRGRIREEKQSVPFAVLDKLLARKIGEVSRWFRGGSPSWANLTLVMTALEAEWPDLKQLPTKSERRSAACWEAILLIRRLSKGEKHKQKDVFGPHVVRCLLALFSNDKWPQERRVPDRRMPHLEHAAEELQIPAKELDAIDTEWGNHFAVLLQVYANSLDEQIWQ